MTGLTIDTQVKSLTDLHQFLHECSMPGLTVDT